MAIATPPRKGDVMSVATPRKELPAIETGPVHPVLLDMADLISRRGWCQGSFDDENGGLCVLGAFYALLEQDDSWTREDDWEAKFHYALHALEKSIGPEMGTNDEWWDVADWNDMPGRTKLEVVDRLRRVGWTGR